MIHTFFILFTISGLNAQIIIRQSAWQQKVDFEINVNLHPGKNTLKAFMKVHYFNNSPDTLRSIWMHVWPNAYKNIQTAYAVQEVRNGNTDFQFSHEKDKGHIDGLLFLSGNDTLLWQTDSLHIDIIELKLAKPLLPGGELKFTTPFNVKLPKIFSRSGGEDSFFAVTQWFPKPAVYDVNGWNAMPYLNQGEFYSEFGNFKVDIVVPKQFTVASTGNRIYEHDTMIDDTIRSKHYCFTEKNIHDFAWFASPRFWIQHNTISLPNGDTVHVHYYEHGKDLASLIRKRANSNKTWPIELGILGYSKRVGNYPYKNCTAVVGKLVAGGGMEYPTITVCSSSDDEVIIHEVGHNWFYGMLGNNERRYPWMDESINSFYEKKICEKLNGDPEFYKKFKGTNWLKNYGTLTGYLFSARQGISQPLNLPSEEFTGLNYGAIVYAKGPLLFAYLEQQLGDSLFSNCMMNYFSEWQYRHPLPGDMHASFEKTSGMDLGWFFIDMMNENNTTDIVKTKNGYTVKGSVKLDSFLHQRKTTNPNPFGFLPEADYYNNGQKLKPVSIAFPLRLPRQNARVEMNVTPVAGFNYYDKLYLGAALYNRTIFRKKFEYELMPAYAIGTKKMVGYGKLNYLMFPKNENIFKVESGVQGQSFGIDINGQTPQYYRVNPYMRIFLKHKGKVNEMRRRQIDMNYYHTGLQNTNYESGDSTWSFPSSYFFNYYKLSYMFENLNTVNSFGFKINAEYGANYKMDPLANNYIKSWLNASYKYVYDKKNKYFRTELFAGIFLDKKGTTRMQQFYMSGNSGTLDYTYNEAMMGRSENVYDDNILGRQIINTNGNMRNLLPYDPTDKWMLSLNSEVCIPGVIPLKVYCDLGYYPYVKPIHTSSGTIIETGKPELYTTAGVILSLFRETLEVFVPFYQSKQFTDKEPSDYNFGRAIGFKLNLNKMHPFTIADSIRP